MPQQFPEPAARILRQQREEEQPGKQNNIYHQNHTGDHKDTDGLRHITDDAKVKQKQNNGRQKGDPGQGGGFQTADPLPKQPADSQGFIGMVQIGQHYPIEGCQGGTRGHNRDTQDQCHQVQDDEIKNRGQEAKNRRIKMKEVRHFLFSQGFRKSVFSNEAGRKCGR